MKKKRIGQLAEGYLRQSITRRQAIKVGGMATAGLIFSKPLISTIRPKPAWGQVSPCPLPLSSPIEIDWEYFGPGTLLSQGPFLVDVPVDPSGAPFDTLFFGPFAWRNAGPEPICNLDGFISPLSAEIKGPSAGTPVQGLGARIADELWNPGELSDNFFMGVFIGSGYLPIVGDSIEAFWEPTDRSGRLVIGVAAGIRAEF